MIVSASASPGSASGWRGGPMTVSSKTPSTMRPC
jgi:hypothetical protein